MLPPLRVGILEGGLQVVWCVGVRWKFPAGMRSRPLIASGPAWWVRDVFARSAFSYALVRLTCYGYRQGITHLKYFLSKNTLYLRTTGRVVTQVLPARALRTSSAWVLLASPTNDSSLLPKLQKLQFSSRHTYDFMIVEPHLPEVKVIQLSQSCTTLWTLITLYIEFTTK
jgi:hypothetical protein